MQDSTITHQQAKELNLILKGTAPYSDLKYRDLVEKNRPALETMLRGSSIPACIWGIDYGLGNDGLDWEGTVKRELAVLRVLPYERPKAGRHWTRR
jgi:hypothetical protein